MTRDLTEKNLVEEAEVFADISNVNLYDGRNVIQPEDLALLPQEMHYKDSEGKPAKVMADVRMRWRKNGSVIAMIQIENQSEINNIMPIRDLGDDERLQPVITFVLYYGKEGKLKHPEEVQNAKISVPFTCKKITENLFNNGNNWKVSDEFIGKEIPETENVRIKAVYTDADAANYETTIVEVEVQRSKCHHNLDKVTAAAATEVQEGNKEYYICKDCGKLFEDAQGMFEITKESTVIPKLEKNSQVSETPKHTETPKPTETSKLTKIPEDTAASVQILPALIQPMHAFTKGSKTYDNPAGVRISGNGKRTLKVGKSIKINAKVVLPKDKKCRWHTAKIRYLVSDTKVVSVSTKGKIMAKSVGKATVYAIAQNGAMAKVKVIVRN